MYKFLKQPLGLLLLGGATALAAAMVLLPSLDEWSSRAPLVFVMGVVAYLAADQSKSLQGTVYVDGSFPFTRSVNLGNVTLQ